MTTKKTFGRVSLIEEFGNFLQKTGEPPRQLTLSPHLFAFTVYGKYNHVMCDLIERMALVLTWNIKLETNQWELKNSILTEIYEG